jgi:hypothetical protein
MFHVHSPKHTPPLWGLLPLQRPCHAQWRSILLDLAFFCGLIAPAYAQPPAHDYPTEARVEYVNECIARNGGKLSQLYQCSCVIDDIANRLTYDEFVEAATFDRYATLPGEGGGIFRDPEQGKAKAKQLREIEKNAYRACGLAP